MLLLIKVFAPFNEMLGYLSKPTLSPVAYVVSVKFLRFGKQVTYIFRQFLV